MLKANLFCVNDIRGSILNIGPTLLCIQLVRRLLYWTVDTHIVGLHYFATKHPSSRV